MVYAAMVADTLLVASSKAFVAKVSDIEYMYRMQQEQDCLQLNEQINTAFIRLIALSADNFQVQLNKPMRYGVNNRPMETNTA